MSNNCHSVPNGNNAKGGSGEDVESGSPPPPGECPPTTSTTTTRYLGLGATPFDHHHRSVRRWICRILVMFGVVAVLGAASAAIWYYLGWMAWLQLVLVAAVAYLAAGKYRWFYVALRTAPRDIRALSYYIRLLWKMRTFSARNTTIAEIFQNNVKRHPDKVAILYEDQEWTFAHLEAYSNRVANIFRSHGYKKGDVVALLMENRPEFIGTWLGLSKLGVITPLINTNQRLVGLIHSITVAKSQAVIFSGDFEGAIIEVLDKIESKVTLYKFNCATTKTPHNDKFRNFNQLLEEAVSTPPPATEPIGYHDRLVYIYTSGTTGLPKAAVINNSRYIFIAIGTHYLSSFRLSDRFYTPLPLYHTAGGCMATGQMLIFGSTLIIRRKFSASAYFPDCVKYGATVAQYIGEMCRYVLATPPSVQTDTGHRVRVIFGNGLRPQIWKPFVDRFRIDKVAEFYGATEGNANIVNIDNTIGAIGFVSRIIPTLYPIFIIKVDPETGEPIRNAKGLCIQCGANEPGVFVGKIVPSNPTRHFLGYVDEEASKKKIVHDILHCGDQGFLSGDLIVSDEFGYLYFKDRTGDTFRWKGENVSTSEVEAVLSNLVQYKDVVVYGVEIQGQEGRAGMAAVYDPDDVVNLTQLSNGVTYALPTYARPIFIRILHKIDMTGTYKMKKIDLQKEGFNPMVISDKLYYLDGSRQGAYSPLTADVYEKIQSGKIRV